VFNVGAVEILWFVFMLAVVVGVIALGVNFGIRLSRRKRQPGSFGP
jgi:hypothetical protein